jgi:hypothetical protein
MLVNCIATINKQNKKKTLPSGYTTEKLNVCTCELLVTQVKEGQHLQTSKSLSINLQNRLSTRETKVQGYVFEKEHFVYKHLGL